MSNLISFFGNKELKKKYVNRLKEHRRLDEIIQGTGFDGHRGCAVGCTLDNYSHAAYETELGIPEFLARLEDTIFEGLPAKEAKNFAVDMLLAVPVGVNLDKVKWQFSAFVLSRDIKRVLSLDIPDALKDEVATSIGAVLSVHKNAISTGVFDESEARTAGRSAESAAESAAWSAAWSAAESAAESSRSAAESAARSAAWSAAARSAEYCVYAKELARLLKAAK